MHSLESKKYLVSYEKAGYGKVRKYYSITGEGKKYLKSKLEEWDTYTAAVSNILIVTGLFPLMGTTLPFFSLGITNIIIDYILLGFVLSIYRYQDIRVEKEPVTTLLA